MEHIKKYIEWADENPDKVCKKIKLLIKNKIKPTLKKIEDKNQIYYDPTEPARIIKFCNSLIIDKTGAQIELILWQEVIIELTYGIKRIDDDVYYFRDLFLFVAKKNGKSSFVSALILYHLLAKPSEDIILVACTSQQTKINYYYIKSFCDNTLKLKSEIESGSLYFKESFPFTISYKPTGSRIRIIPETVTKASQGTNATLLYFDEIASYKSNEIIQTLSTGQTRPNAIRIATTTAETTTDNPGMEFYQRGSDIVSGKYASDKFLPWIFEQDKSDKSDKKDDQKSWIKSNPSIGITKFTWKMQEEYDLAIQSRVNLPAFESYHLNLWSSNGNNLGITDDEWGKIIINADKYSAYLSDDILQRCPAWLSIDLSKVNDFSVYTICFFIAEIQKYYMLHKCFVPQTMVTAKQKTDNENLNEWIKQGLIIPTISETDTINYDFIRDEIVRDFKKYPKIQGMSYDIYHAKNFINELNTIDQLKPLPMIIFDQSYKRMGPSVKNFVESIYSSKIIDNNPVMRWMISCAQIYLDRNNNMSFLKIDYRKTNRRIDLLDTSTMALICLQESITKIPQNNNADKIARMKALAEQARAEGYTGY